MDDEEPYVIFSCGFIRSLKFVEKWILILSKLFSRKVVNKPLSWA